MDTELALDETRASSCGGGGRGLSLRRNSPGVEALGLGVGDSVSSWAMSGCAGGVDGGQEGCLFAEIASGLTGGGDAGSGCELPANPPARNLRMPFMAVAR